MIPRNVRLAEARAGPSPASKGAQAFVEFAQKPHARCRMSTRAEPRRPGPAQPDRKSTSLNASAPPQQLSLDSVVGFWGQETPPRVCQCTAVGAPGHYPTASLESVFAEAGLPMIVRITPFTLPQNLDALLGARGLLRFDDTRVMALADLSALSAHAPLPAAAKFTPSGWRRLLHNGSAVCAFASFTTAGARSAAAELAGAVPCRRDACGLGTRRLRAVRDRGPAGGPVRRVHRTPRGPWLRRIVMPTHAAASTHSRRKPSLPSGRR